MAQICEKCGKPMAKGMKFCPQCGNLLKKKQNYIKVRIEVIWAALAIMGSMCIALFGIFFMLLL